MNSTGSPWRKSTYSASGKQNCVEVAATAQGVAAVRDSQDREGPQLAVAQAQFPLHRHLHDR